jgi:hypothetical protein
VHGKEFFVRCAVILSETPHLTGMAKWHAGPGGSVCLAAESNRGARWLTGQRLIGMTSPTTDGHSSGQTETPELARAAFRGDPRRKDSQRHRSGGNRKDDLGREGVASRSLFTVPAPGRRHIERNQSLGQQRRESKIIAGGP